MSGKILYGLDDNPKQLGCINGFLQHLLSGRVINGAHGDHHHKRLPPAGQGKMESKDGKQVTNKEKKSVKNNNKEMITSMMSTESSSSSSSSMVSSSSSSSNLASINNHQLSLKSLNKQQIKSNVLIHIDSPRPLQPSNHQKLSRAQNHHSSPVIKDKKKPHARRLSYDGRESVGPTLKPNELPRLSLDSKQGRVKSVSVSTSEFKSGLLREEPGSNRAVSNIVEPTLKLNELPRLSLDSRQGRVKSSSVSTSTSVSTTESGFLREEPGSNRAVSSIVARLMGLDDLPQQSIPRHKRSSKSEDLDLVSRSTRSTEESDTDLERQSVSIYKEIDKRLGDLDFKKSSKDLRALKHILEAMQRAKPKMETENRTEENIEETCSIKQSFQKSNHKDLAPKQGSLPRVRTRQETNPKPRVLEKRRAKDLSPKTPQKCGKLEKFSQERRARSSVNVITSNQETKNATKMKNSRQNTKSRTKKVVDQCDIVHTPRPSQNLYKTMDEESTTIVKEQPSPVSVLDADFYDDESLSPIKNKTTDFRDEEEDNSPLSTQEEWISAEDTNHLCNNNTRSRFSSSYNMGKTNKEFLTSIIAKDLAKSWADFSTENSWLVLDIERLMFKDLIVELLHGELSC